MNFTCPHCGAVQVVTERAYGNFSGFAHIGKCAELQAQADNLSVTGQAVRCADPECNRATVVVSLGEAKEGTYGSSHIEGSEFYTTRVYPVYKGKPFPKYVPPAMLADYQEAWSIIELSAKSSATLARRCLQAMIRDFCGIRENTLHKEIEVLESRLKDDLLPKGVEPETVAAMRVVKNKGNIGAHMTEIGEALVDVEPGEAATLLSLIEMLFADWYVGRGKRRAQLAAIEALDQRKLTSPDPHPSPTSDAS